jgi:nucleotide-binding universal stress UspA family protein
MIKDVMVRLDGSADDEVRLAAAVVIARLFDSQVIGLLINELPLLVPEEGGSIATVEVLNRARAIGDQIEAKLRLHLASLDVPWELKRHDIVGDDAGAAEVASREARAADTFIALRPNGIPREPDRLVEEVIFGSGRHVFLVPYAMGEIPGLHRVMVAWNGSREAARALAESLPYLQMADSVTVVVIVAVPEAEDVATLGTEAIHHLEHHGVAADLRHVKTSGDTGEALMAEAARLRAELVVLGGYGHSRIREWLLGGVTYKLLHEATVPLLVAH